MKTIKFAKRWRRPTSKTTHEIYPEGCEVTVTEEIAAAAVKAGVLAGDPVDAAPAQADPAKAKTAKA